MEISIKSPLFIYVFVVVVVVVVNPRSEIALLIIKTRLLAQRTTVYMKMFSRVLPSRTHKHSILRLSSPAPLSKQQVQFFKKKSRDSKRKWYFCRNFPLSKTFKAQYVRNGLILFDMNT